MSNLLDDPDLLEPETQRSGWDAFAGLSAEIERELTKVIMRSDWSADLRGGSKAGALAQMNIRTGLLR